MKILVLNYEFPPIGGGAAPVSKDIAEKLCERGHDVVVVTMGFGNLLSYEEINGVRIYRVESHRKSKNVCKPWEQLLYLIMAERLVKKLMMQQKFDICHAHFIVPTGVAARWIKRKYHIPYILTAHGSDVEGHNQKSSMKIMHRILRGAWRKIVKDSSAVVSPSRYLMGVMNQNYPCDKYIYIPNGIEWDMWHKLSGGKKEKRILVMGRLQRFKNVQMILQAFGQTGMGEWQADILGDGPFRGALEQMVENLLLSDKVHFHGWLDNGSKEQMEIVKKASVYITASRFENCPMSVMEAVAAGCYPVLSDIPGHRQLIDDDAYFFDLSDIRSLSRKIERLVREGIPHGWKGVDVSSHDWKDMIDRYEYLIKMQ